MRILSIFVIVILLNLTPLPLSAQTLALGASIEDQLESGGDARYSFTAREGQLMSFVGRAEDDLDVMLTIEDLSGRAILGNDDYDYPDSRDAIIEGFVAPYTGSYTLIVSAYGNTSGDYSLQMLPGYSTLVIQSSFDATEDWQAIGTDLIDAPTLNVVNGTANLVQSGIDRVGVGVGYALDQEIWFARTTIASISDTAGWRVGMVFGYQDASNFHRVTVNHRGAWRVVAVQNNEETVLRDWNVHPAIVPDDRSFTLAVLANGTQFDIFYDDQYIGTATNTNFEQGQLGLVAETINAIGSEVTARFDDLVITSPTLLDDSPIFPTSVIAQGTNGTIRELQQRLLIPTEGELSFTLSESFAQNNQLGVSRFPIGDGRLATNFALGARVSWVASQADLNGCGIVIRDDGSENYLLAYLDSQGGYGLSEHSAGEFIQNSFNMRMDNQRPPHDILLIVSDDTVHYYVNNQHALSMTVGIRDGAIAEAVINFDAVNTNCQFNNLWVWEW